MTEPRKALLAVLVMAGAVVAAQAVFRVASAPLREVLRLPGLDMPATPSPPAASPPAPPVAPPPAPALAEGGIFGRVLAGGEPVQGVEIDVRLDDPAATPQLARTGEDGSYRVPFLLPGRTYRVLAPGAEPRLVTLPPEGGDLRVDLASGPPQE